MDARIDKVAVILTGEEARAIAQELADLPVSYRTQPESNEQNVLGNLLDAIVSEIGR